MSLIRAVVIGNTQFTKYVLETLCNSPGYEVLCLFQTPNFEDLPDYINLASYCLELGVTYKIYENLYQGISTTNAIKYTANMKPDVILMMGFPTTIHESFGKIAPCIASFEGILPECAGDSPIPWSLLKKLPNSGLTFYKSVSNHPYGNIILQKSVPILPEDDATSLFNKVCGLSDSMLDDLRIQIALKLPVQKIFKDSEIKYYWPMFSKDICKIDWSKSCEEIVDLVKATTFPYYGAWAPETHDRIIVVWKAIPGKFKTNKAPGSLVYKDDSHYVVTTGTVDLDIKQFMIL